MKRILVVFLFLSLICPVCYGASNPPNISAEAAILVDTDSGRVLFEKNSDIKKGIASITKLLTALVAVESTPDLSKTITISADHWAEGTSMYLKAGESVTLEELLYGLLLQSGNDAALAIAACCAGDTETFVTWMNEWAEDLGMVNSHFANPSGLDEEGHYSTAYDMSLVARAILQNKTLRQIVATRSITKAGRTLTNHNKLLWQYEGCIGLKTGYTIASGRTLVSAATKNGQTLICVTLNAPNDWEDHTKLLDYGFETWQQKTLSTENKVFHSLQIEGSLLPKIKTVTAKTVTYPLSTEESIHAVVSLPKQATAPIQQGDIAGKVTFYLGEQLIGESDLLYAETAPDNRAKPTLKDRVRAFLFRKASNGTDTNSIIALF